MDYHNTYKFNFYAFNNIKLIKTKNNTVSSDLTQNKWKMSRHLFLNDVIMCHFVRNDDSYYRRKYLSEKKKILTFPQNNTFLNENIMRFSNFISVRYTLK